MSDKETTPLLHLGVGIDTARYGLSLLIIPSALPRKDLGNSQEQNYPVQVP